MKAILLCAVAATCVVLVCVQRAEGANFWDLMDEVEKRSCQGKIPQGQFCNPQDKKDVCCGSMGCYNVRGHNCDPYKEVCICRPKNRYPF